MNLSDLICIVGLFGIAAFAIWRITRFDPTQFRNDPVEELRDLEDNLDEGLAGHRWMNFADHRREPIR